jgi:hypothetical protein
MAQLRFKAAISRVSSQYPLPEVVQNEGSRTMGYHIIHIIHYLVASIGYSTSSKAHAAAQPMFHAVDKATNTLLPPDVDPSVLAQVYSYWIFALFITPWS